MFGTPELDPGVGPGTPLGGPFPFHVFHGEVLGASPASPVDVEGDGCVGGQLGCSRLLHELKVPGKVPFSKTQTPVLCKTKTKPTKSSEEPP